MTRLCRVRRKAASHSLLQQTPPRRFNTTLVVADLQMQPSSGENTGKLKRTGYSGRDWLRGLVTVGRSGSEDWLQWDGETERTGYSGREIQRTGYSGTERLRGLVTVGESGSEDWLQWEGV